MQRTNLALLAFHLTVGTLANQLPLQIPLSANTVTVALLSGDGDIVGSVSDFETFNGIPYADPPVGSLRLRPPQRPSKRLGRVDGTAVAASCPSMPLGRVDPRDPTFLKDSPIWTLELDNGAEDCLTVTVTRPKGTKETDKLPVVFGIFGTGFVYGNQRITSDIVKRLLSVATEADLPFIFVTVNYRVAGFGFLGGKEILADGAANLGLLDQRMALEWVADNIASFGGDPDMVTLWGEGSGAVSVFDQMLLFDGMATYKDKTLFGGAVMSSGSILPAAKIDSTKAQQIYDTVVERAGCKGQSNTLQCLRKLSYEDFLQASNSVPELLSYNSPALSYLPRPDGKVLKDSPEKLAKAGQYHAVPAIMGTQQDEGTVFSWRQANITITPNLADYLTGYFEQADASAVGSLLKLYPNDPRAGSPFDTGLKNMFSTQFKRLAAIIGDVFATFPRRLAAELMAENNPDVAVYAYVDASLQNVEFLGTSHGTFGNLLQTDFAGFCVNFISTKNPAGKGAPSFNWPKWTGKAKKILRVTQSSLFPYQLLTDNFRDADYQFIKNNVEAFSF